MKDKTLIELDVRHHTRSGKIQKELVTIADIAKALRVEYKNTTGFTEWTDK